MICWPVLSTSTTPISTTREVVITIRAVRFIANGKSRRMVCGRMTRRMAWELVRPRARALSRWWRGMDPMAPRTRSPISAVPQMTKTITAAVRPPRLIPALVDRLK